MSRESSWREIKPRDIVFGIILPVIVGLIIRALPLSEPAIMKLEPALVGIFV